MIDFAEARRIMVEGQVRTFDVTDLRVLEALSEVPRERFVSESDRMIAYIDRDLPAPGRDGGPQRFLLKPAILAKLLQAAGPGPSDHVLDVGCATGYSSAVLAKLARSVVALEEDPILAETAKKNLSDLGISNTKVVTGPLFSGVSPEAPFQVIAVEGAMEVEPKELFAQLAEGGRLVGVRGRVPFGKGMIYRACGGTVTGLPFFDFGAPVLPGFTKPPQFVF
jgi:protein-L-isoaspartate(D-aspartate) O-methyltransferase